MKKAVVALSGGIDSSVSALLLKQQGYEVVGLTGKMTEASDVICQNAKKVADLLQIEHHIFDATLLFQEKIINYFEKSYARGETPNPCIMCNKFVIWGVLFDYAIKNLCADIFATGHYATIKHDNGIYRLFPAKDETKDQLYFLHKLNQKHLAKTIFPLSDYTKEQVKQIAIDFNLPSKDSKESQDICFIEKPFTTKKYLIDKLGLKKGDFVEIGTGKKIGEHDGCYFFTIGQRKGIGISAPYPLYVIDIDADKNIVYLGKSDDNYKTRLALKDVNFVYDITNNVFDAMVKIRYNMTAKKAKCKIIDDFIEIEFYEPVNSITPGQAGVIYNLYDGHLIAGGTVI